MCRQRQDAFPRPGTRGQLGAVEGRALVDIGRDLLGVRAEVAQGGVQGLPGVEGGVVVVVQVEEEHTGEQAPPDRLVRDGETECGLARAAHSEHGRHHHRLPSRRDAVPGCRVQASQQVLQLLLPAGEPGRDGPRRGGSRIIGRKNNGYGARRF
ncbi:hypothetical protein GCM10010430_76710 [Kitasatospora cystarginea]|uniref:Uncharacterized protein n=1 Tax=Kitasatospora cystarginea TaxID=58350 RepID=A0ABN3F0I9_9ACTN